MAREPQPVTKDRSESPSLLAPVEQVTYTPGPGDNLETQWMGHKFKAHVPHDVRNPKLVEMARANKFFHVGPFDPKVHGYEEKIVEPKTAEQYRAWAINWMKTLPDVETACEKWANEARMRHSLEVGYDDYKYISDFFQPILSDLLRQEAEPRQVRDKLIRQHEFADLVLQIEGLVGYA